MNRLSLKLDESMKWIYDPSHPDYQSDKAKYLRDAREAALNSCPQWMIEEARMNDVQRALTPNVSDEGPPVGGPSRSTGSAANETEKGK